MPDVVAQGGAERLRVYWAHGEGAAKIRWGTSGDHARCVRLVREEAPGMADVDAYCAERHHDALGFWPATHAYMEKHGGKTPPAASAVKGTLTAAGQVAPALVPPLVTIPAVDIVATGNWRLSSGDQTFSRKDLTDAIAAAQCPAVGSPVINIGHVDPRFDGEPALGRVINMRLTAGGNKITADLAGMPGWLGAVAASAYPRRSIEGMYGFHCQIGHVHPFAITALKLLGVTPPGVGVLGGLPDVAALFGVAASGPVPRQAGTAWRLEAGGDMTEVLAASITEADVRRAYYEDDGVPKTRWITELQMSPAQLIVADEATAKTYRVPFRIEAGAVVFDTAVEVASTYADIAATRGTGPMVAYASAAVSRDVPPRASDGGGDGGGDPAGDGHGGDGDGGLDESWADVSDLPDLTGLTVADLEAALAEEEGRAAASADMAALEAAAKLGTGSRFKALVSALTARKAHNPRALAAWIGRKNYGKAKFAALAKRARKAHASGADPAGVRVDAAGRHGPWTGTHSHAHAAMGAQGSDQSHDHSHSHDGSGSHAHVHAAAGATGGGDEVDFTDEQRTALRSALGLAEDDDLTADAVVTAAGALRERADAKVTAGARPPLPPGVITVEQEAWDAMTRKVQAADEFRAKVQRGERDQVIAAAVSAGKFSPAQQDRWRRIWDRDPEGTRQVLASLKPNVVPVEDIGTPGTDDDLTPDEYRSLFPPEYQERYPQGAGAAPQG